MPIIADADQKGILLSQSQSSKQLLSLLNFIGERDGAKNFAVTYLKTMLETGGMKS